MHDTAPTSKRARPWTLAPWLALPLMAACSSSPGAGARPGRVPDRPPSSTSAATDAQTITFALRDIDLDQLDPSKPLDAEDQPWRSIGLNLDGHRTTSARRRASCQAEELAAPLLDGETGIDNVFGSAIVSQLFSGLAIEEDICCQHARGVGTVLLRVTRWNGMANDASVEVGVMVASAGTSEDPETVQWSAITVSDTDLRGVVRASDGVTVANPPAWLVDTDTWYVAADQVESGDLDRSRHRDVNAYVVDGVIVMKLSEMVPLVLYARPTASAAFHLVDGRLLARMSADFGQVDKGTVAGRMGRSQLDAFTLSVHAQIAENPAACGGIASASGVVVDTAGDMRLDPTLDDTASSAPCDAVSVGVGFHAIRARGVRLAAQPVCFLEPNCSSDPSWELCAPVNAIGDACDEAASQRCSLPEFVPSTSTP